MVRKLEFGKWWRWGLILSWLFCSGQVHALQTLFPSPQPSTKQLVIASSTDTPIFQPMIQAFQQQQPDVSIIYLEMDTIPLYEGVIQKTLKPTPDIIISSAPDLQFKLANDGWALAHASPYVEQLPAWAQWRNELFGFTYEPIVMIYNKELLSASEVPTSHSSLIEWLEKRSGTRHRQISTYDIASSGAGYVFASQDAQITSNFWRLANALGPANVSLANNSGVMLESLSSGKVALAYNVLGAYAYNKVAENPNLAVIIPNDYVLVFSRTALINRLGINPNTAKDFIDFLLSPQGQFVAANTPGLGAIMPGTNGQWTAESFAKQASGVIRPIELRPALLAGLDQRRRQQFILTWKQIVTDKK